MSQVETFGHPADQSSELPTGTAELIDHILLHYHEKHRRQLPELVQMARRVEQVHAGKAGVPVGLGDVLQRALGELEVHMRKEELILFPAMRRPDGPRSLDGPTSQMREDHGDQERMLEKVTVLTDDFTPPEGACGTWQALYAGAAEFKDDLIRHIDIENTLLFPRFEGMAQRAQPITTALSGVPDFPRGAESERRVGQAGEREYPSVARSPEGRPAAPRVRSDGRPRRPGASTT